MASCQLEESSGDAETMETSSDESAGEQEEQMDWRSDPNFKRYWRHYEQAQQWLRGQQAVAQELKKPGREYQRWCQAMWSYHAQCSAWMQQYSQHYMQVACGYQQQAATLSATQIFPQTTATVSYDQQNRDMHLRRSETHATPPSRKSKRKKKKKRNKKLKKPTKGKKRKHLLFSDLEDIPSDLEFVLDLSGDLEAGKGLTDGVEYHMEISEDMLEFFAQSAKHKQEREAERKAQLNPEGDSAQQQDYTDLADVSAHRQKAQTTAAPKEQPGLRRASEMQKLYGEDAPMIHAMETAMQLTYQRNCDRKQPRLWPQIPLNIKFVD